MVQTLFNSQDCERLDINQVQQLYRQYVNPGQVELLGSFGFGRELVIKAQGCLLETDQGHTVLDFTGGMGMLNHGHNHPRIIAARRLYQQHLRMEVHKNYLSPHLAALSHNIACLLPDDLNICYFPNSGAEAVEGAIKMAYKYHQGQRQQVLHADISYHGKLLGAASISGSSELHFRFPEIPGAHAFVYDQLSSVEHHIKQLRKEDGSSDIYALIIEPMSASTLKRCSGDYLRALRQLCDHEDIVLVFDEVFSGWCKSGELFYFMQHKVTPDILITSKSLGGGKSSLSGFVAREKIFHQAYGNLNDALLHSTSYNGYGEECATALEAVNIVVDDHYSKLAKSIDLQLGDGLKALQQKYPKLVREVRGQGALQGILLHSGSGLLQSITQQLPIRLLKDEKFIAKLITAAVINHLYEHHRVLTYHVENREILLMAAPPLVVSSDEIDQFLQALDQTLREGFARLCLKFVKSKLFTSFMQRVQKENTA